ncbi:MAG: hypothetical protein ABR529_12425 [Actinomycetota bacterium]
MSGLGLRLVDEVSNDLRFPITVVKGCVETVRNNWEVLDAEGREELLSAALKSADELIVSVEALEARLEVIDQALAARNFAPRPISLDEEMARRSGP